MTTDRKVHEVRTADGRRLMIEDIIETGPPEAFLRNQEGPDAQRERYGLLDVVRHSAASLTYLVIVLLSLRRVFGETNDLGYKVVMAIGIPLFLWAIAICWLGRSALFLVQDDPEQLVKLVRVAGIVGAVPMLVIAWSLLFA